MQDSEYKGRVVVRVDAWLSTTLLFLPRLRPDKGRRSLDSQIRFMTTNQQTRKKVYSINLPDLLTRMKTYSTYPNIQQVMSPAQRL